MRPTSRQNPSCLSPQFPEALHGKAAGRAAVRGRGGPRDPLGEVNCFNHGPMRAPDKRARSESPSAPLLQGEPARLGAGRGLSSAPVTTAGLRFICFIPGDSEGSSFPG